MFEDKKTFELKVGLFMLLGLIVLFGIVFSIGDINMFRNGYHIKILFNFANGIAESAPVRLAGVQIGEVEKINIYYDEKEARTKILLNVMVNKNVKIEKDSRATINTLGLLGEKYLEVFPGTDKTSFLADEDLMIGHDPVAVEMMTEEMGKLLTDVSDIVGKLKNSEGTFGKFITDPSIYNNLEEFTADIKENPWKLFSQPRDRVPEKKPARGNFSGQ